MRERPVLLGMNNPLSVNPKYALFPHPEGCTGWRIWQMLKSRVPEVTRKDYLDAFDRRNLVNGVHWDADQARAAADAMRAALLGRVVVVLGTSPRMALGLAPQLIHPVEDGGVTWRQVPHPSGRNLWYNDETNRSMVAMLLESLYVEWRSNDVRQSL